MGKRPSPICPNIIQRKELKIMMTNNKKERIRKLRMQGLSYVKVAERTGLKLETVKSFCRCHGLRGEGKTLAGLPDAKYKYVYCKNCGMKIMQEPKRKKKMFCCDACRNLWWKEHPYMIDRKAYYDFVFPNCGKAFQAYGASKRK